MKSLKGILILLLAMPAGMAVAQADLQIGARPQGLGGAYTAVANDANAIFWNPSGLSQIGRPEASLMHWSFAELNQLAVDYGAFAYPLSRGTVGLAWTRQAATLEEGPDNSSSTLDENTFTLSYGLRLTSFLAGGMSLTRSTIDSRVGSGAGIGLEFGALVKPLGSDIWTLGLAAKNVAANLKNESLTPYYLAGTAVSVGTADSMHTVLLAFDVNTRNDIEGKEGVTFKYATGLEYRFMSGGYGFAMRGGTGSKSTSLGFGLRYQFLSLDYAFVSMKEGVIGNSHKFGLGFYFNP